MKASTLKAVLFASLLIVLQGCAVSVITVSHADFAVGQNGTPSAPLAP